MDTINNYECEYKLDEKVEITSGLYKGRIGLFKGITKPQNKTETPSYSIEIKYKDRNQLILCKLDQTRKPRTLTQKLYIRG